MTDWTRYRSYVAVNAVNEAEAREVSGLTDAPLVHVEPEHEEGEVPTFLFAVEREAGEDADMLHAYFTLDQLPNMPLEYF